MKLLALSLWSKINLLLLVTVCVAVIIYSSYSYRLLEKESLKHAKLLHLTKIDTHKQAINNLIQAQKAAILSFALEPKFRNYINEYPEGEPDDLTHHIDSFMQTFSGFERVALLNSQYDIIFSHDHLIEPDAMQESMFSGAIQPFSAMSKIPVYIDTFIDNEGHTLLRFSLPVSILNQHDTVTLVFDYNIVEAIRNLPTSDELDVGIVSQQGKVLYDTSAEQHSGDFNMKKLMQEHRETILRTRKSYFFANVSNQDYFIAHSRIPITSNPEQQITIIHATPRSLIMATVDKTLQFQVIITAFTILMTVVIFFYFSRRMIAPLSELTNAMRDYDPRTEIQPRKTVITREDEIGKLYNAFYALNTQLKNTFDKLGEKIEELEVNNIALEKAHARAKVAAEAKNNFLAVMSHEIRTPLNSIVGFSQLLEDEESIERRNDYCKVMRRSSDRLLLLINNILDFSRLNSGKVTPKLEDCNLHDEIASITSTYSLNAQDKGLEYQMELDAVQGVHTKIDRVWLDQILSNLIGNALKYTKTGNICLRVWIDSGDLAHPRLTLEVSDTGIGIASALQQKIFDTFEQVDNSIARSYQGTGLGLAIVKRIVELSEGEISVDSKLEQGSTFTVRLPLSEGTTECITDTFPVEGFIHTTLPPGTAILQVEDDPSNAELLETCLYKAGAKKVTTVDNQHAIQQALKTGTYHIILMDIHLGADNGIELTRLIRNGTLAPDSQTKLPLFIVTAFTNPEMKSQAMEAGATGFLLKPIVVEQLINQIKKQLSPPTNSDT